MNGIIIKITDFVLSKLKIKKSNSFLNKLFISNYLNDYKIKKTNDNYTVKDKLSKLVFSLRKLPSSDLKVFKQVFIDKEYEILKSLVKYNYETNKSLRVIDAGANIGLTSVYLSEYFENLEVVAIEADSDNYHLLKKNIDQNDLGSKIDPILKALYLNDNVKLFVNNNFRDGNDWSLTTSLKPDDNSNSVESITVQTILKTKNWELLDILKIDIEGGEKDLFINNPNINFLNKTKVVILEVHEEVVKKCSVIKVLKDFNFIVFDYKESIVGVNKDYV